MNQRIRELAIQSGLLDVEDLKYATPAEKFAELIVKECANIAFNQADHYSETQNKGSAMSAADCVGRLIKIKFGVE